jgi:hypothetical protein
MALAIVMMSMLCHYLVAGDIGQRRAVVVAGVSR